MIMVMGIKIRRKIKNPAELTQSDIPVKRKIPKTIRKSVEVFSPCEASDFWGQDCALILAFFAFVS